MATIKKREGKTGVSYLIGIRRVRCVRQSGGVLHDLEAGAGDEA